MSDVQDSVDSNAAGRIAPLSEIRLHNFKSVAEATVDLRMLTAIVGRNSSGKSTLLQSVLALAQAVKENSSSGQFPLNGSFVRLGTFGEVLNFNAADGEDISVGFTVTSNRRTSFMPRSIGAGRIPQRSLFEVTWDATLKEPENAENGFAQLSKFEFQITPLVEDESIGRVELKIVEVRGGESSGASDDSYRMRRGFSDATLNVIGRIANFGSDGGSSRVDSVELVGGLPIAAFKRVTRFEVLVRRWWDVYKDVLGDEYEAAKRTFADIESEAPQRPSIRAVTEASKEFIEAYELELEGGRFPADLPREIRMGARSFSEAYFRDRAARVGGKKRTAIAKSMVGLGEIEFTERLRKKLKGQVWLDEEISDDAGGDPREQLWPGTRAAETLFRNVSYLGPLREQPNVLYSPGPGEIDLGPKGEYSAAVLHSQTQAGRVVQTPLPDGGVRPMRLGEALNLWLAELGLADSATATDRGRLGIGLTVSPVGSGKNVDLTSVGVGVSQALPVLLLCLLAGRGTVVLLEQPELHLHPAMQLKLADFLLACARSGRQIILETHSEHLVNRLRRHVAEDQSGENRETVRLLFAEQDHGVTSYRYSDINELGGLAEDWPKGFLDVASEEAGELLRLNLRRRSASESGRD